MAATVVGTLRVQKREGEVYARILRLVEERCSRAPKRFARQNCPMAALCGNPVAAAARRRYAESLSSVIDPAAGET